MGKDTLPSTSVLETLLKTNRPPTEQEMAIILEYMAPTNAKLKNVNEQISEMMAHIEALKSQVEQAENQLQRLQEEEAVILETLADHRRVFSPFRNLPEDVLREICSACVQGGIPKLTCSRTPMPYILSQICSGMRHVALTTPLIWASMSVYMKRTNRSRTKLTKDTDVNLAHRAKEWFERARGLGLTLTILFDSNDSHPFSMLVDILLSYSTHWKELQFTSCRLNIPAFIFRIAALRAADVPLLQSVYFQFPPSISSNLELGDNELLKAPTLRCVSLIETCQIFTVNWAILTSVTVHGNTRSEIGTFLRQTKCLEFCEIRGHFSNESYSGEINLPFLKTLVFDEETHGENLSGALSILDAMSAPILEIFETRVPFFDLALSDFLKRSPRIWNLSFMYLDQSKSLKETMEFLLHFPSLTVLSFWISRDIYCPDGDQFLQSFVEDANRGVICPRLQDFDVSGNIDLSLETVRKFLEAKQGDISMPNVLPWKKVRISSYGIKSAGGPREILELVSEKKAEGLDVELD